MTNVAKSVEEEVAARARLSEWDLLRWNSVTTPFSFSIYTAFGGRRLGRRDDLGLRRADGVVER